MMVPQSRVPKVLFLSSYGVRDHLLFLYRYSVLLQIVTRSWQMLATGQFADDYTCITKWHSTETSAL